MLLGGAGMGVSADIEKGVAAYERGDYATALRELKPLAEQGIARAQSYLGVMYIGGRGVQQNWKMAVRWTRLSAEQGNASAQISLGTMYYLGDGLPKDYRKAAQWYRLAAEQGDATAQTQLGEMYHRGDGVPRDDKEAVKWYRLAAEQGDPEGQYNLARMYYRGGGVSKDYKKSMKWHRLAAKQKYSKSYISLGSIYELGKGVTQNYKEAIKWYKLAAEQGHLKAYQYIGDMYFEGKLVPRDYKEGIKWYKTGAKQGSLALQNRLGHIYSLGEEISPDYIQAIKWYQLAAEQGDTFAQTFLGNIYYDGEGIPPDYKTAAKWFGLAASQGFSEAQNTLGTMYSKGQGGPHDDKAAVRFFRLAAEQGHADAQSNLGVMYMLGRGVTQDVVYGHVWANIGASNGSVKGEKLRDLAEQKMTRAQIAEAQILARNIMSKKAIPEVAAKKLQPQSERRKPNSSPRSGSTGSGFFTSKLGHVVTNHHVVNNCKSVSIGENAKSQISADVLETDKRNDLALLKISSPKMASAEAKSLIRKLGISVVPLASQGFLRSDDVELGESVMVSGYPFGDAFSDALKVTTGIVSANRGFGDDTGQFQIDAAVQPGNSGGPIYDENGNIIGVVVAQLNKLKVAKAIGSLPENTNFGIKASTVRQFLTSSGLPTKWSNRSERMSTKEIAKIAKNQTVMVVCHR